MLKLGNQVAEGSHLLDTARDCFHFTTKFFEPINVSATHIYHSALELCPISSIVRKLYYDRCHNITRFPRVVIGTPDSWDQTISISAKDDYKSCAWSPRGRFIAVRMREKVEIRNQLTFELLTTLQSSKYTSPALSLLAFSPDGRSLAVGFPDTIIIWDIQTGGVAKEIKCDGNVRSLVWSLDGESIAVTLYRRLSTQGVETYDVVSGAQLFMKELKQCVQSFLWAYEKSFRFLEVDDHVIEISLSEIGPGSTKTETFRVTAPHSTAIAFSPSTHHMSASSYHTLRVFDIRTSDCVLELSDWFTCSEFSPDGSLLATCSEDNLLIWKYALGGYTLFGKYPLPSYPSPSLHFSPTSSSILIRSMGVLQVRRLDDSPTTPKACHQYAAIFRSGSRIATAYESESTVTIIDLHSQTPVQVIDTGVRINGLVITGNILLVASSETVIAWLVMGEGPVDGVFGKKGASCGDRIWSTSSPFREPRRLQFRVEGQVGVIGTKEIFPFIYHTETGDILDRTHEPQHFSRPWISFYHPIDCQEYHHLRSNDLPSREPPPEDDWLISRTTTQEAGWVVDPQGRHRFWLPVEWRNPWKRENWHHDITTLFIDIGNQPVIIKF